MRPSIPVLLALALLASTLGAHALAATPAATLAEARAAIEEVMTGEPPAMRRGAERLERLSRAAPRDPLLLAYHAESVAVSAWHAATPTEEARLRELATSLAERALTMAPPAGTQAAELRRSVVHAHLAVGRLEFMHGQQGDPAALGRAQALLGRASELAPDEPLPSAYQGTMLVTRAGMLPPGDEQAQLFARGLAQVDRALELAGRAGRPAPTDEAAACAEARLVAAGLFIALPDDAFHRRERGRAILEQQLASPAFGELSPRLRAHTHYQAALLARTEGSRADEASHLRGYVQLAPADDPLAPQVRTRLAEVER